MQIQIKSDQLLMNKKSSQPKVTSYNIGRIALIISVFLTLMTASFIVYCNLF